MENETKLDWDDVERFARENDLMRMPIDKLAKKYLADKEKREKNQESLENESKK